MKLFSLILRVAVAVALIVYLASQVDLAASYHQVLHSDLPLLAAGTLVLALQPIVGSLRWGVILAALQGPVPVGKILRWTYISVFFGQVLPATAGADGIRIWLAARDRVGWRNSALSVALDRLIMLIVLVVLLLAGLSRISEMVGSPWIADLVPLFLAAGILGIGALIMGDAFLAKFDRFRVARSLRYLVQGTRKLFLDPVSLALALGLCILSYLGLVTSLFLYTVAFGGPDIPFAMVVLFPPVLAVSMLPVSLGGWGTREIAMVAALGLVGISAETALLASIWLGISSILISLPGAVFFSWRPVDVEISLAMEPLAEGKQY